MIVVFWCFVLLVAGQFDISDVDIHRAMKAGGFYMGDVNAAWSSRSLDALTAYAAKDNIRFNAQVSLLNWMKKTPTLRGLMEDGSLAFSHSPTLFWNTASL